REVRQEPVLAEARRADCWKGGRSRLRASANNMPASSRLPCSIPSPNGQIEHLKPAKLLRAHAKQIKVNKAKNQLRCNLRVRLEVIEQPDQLQLVVRMRIEPHFDRVVGLAEFDKAEVLYVLVVGSPPAGMAR